MTRSPLSGDGESRAPIYNPSPFGVPLVRVCRVDPFFYGGITEVEDGWYGARSGDRRVPVGGPFRTPDEAWEWVLEWARAALVAAMGKAMDAAAAAQAALMELDDE